MQASITERNSAILSALFAIIRVIQRLQLKSMHHGGWKCDI